MVPRVGQRIGPYEILGRLGSGGMGLVFSAWDARLQRDVAIKLLREEYASPTMRSRFLQEARAASGLNHPNICTVFDIGEVSGDPFLVMELLKGETLRQRITYRGKLPAEDIHRLATDVLEGLCVAHARGVIHRDIKPANIILVNKPGGGFQCKVLDFGLAKVELGDEESVRNDLTTIGTTVGTVSYMSPEQARGEAIDARSDLFSLGSVLYEAATAELPFQGATSALIFVELLGKAPIPARQQNPSLPKDLDRIIMRLLAKSRDERFQSAEDVLAALQAVSLRKSPLGGISLWGSKAPASKPRPESPSPLSESLPQDVSPEPRSSDPPANRMAVDAGSVLRPARRVADPFRAANSPPPPSPSPGVDRAAAADATAPEARSSLPPAREVVLRPVKPDSLRPAPPRDERMPGSGADAPITAAEAVSAPASDDPTGAGSNEAGGPVVPSSGDNASPAPRFLLVQPGPIRPEVDILPFAAARERGEARSSLGRRTGWIVATILVLAAAGSAWYFFWHRAPAASLGPTTILLVPMQNGTGESSLGAALSTGLELATSQSPRLAVRSAEMYLLGLRGLGYTADTAVSDAHARDAARAVGAGVLVFGDIHNEGTSYVLSLHLVDVLSGKRTTVSSETAASREQIAAALDRLSTDLRSALGESSDSIGRTMVPLSREATSNLDALEAFAAGTSLEAAGNPGEALPAYQHAVALEPHFTQAWLRLAGLYLEQHAEVASARAATQAQTDSTAGSSRLQLLAQAGASIYASGDYGRAAELLSQLLAVYPNDLRALNDLALAQLLGGKFSDSQVTAGHVLKLFRYDRQAIGSEEMALIAQGRPEAAAAVEAQAQTLGVSHPGVAILATAASLSGPAMLLPGDRPLPPAIAAGLLDAAGHFSEGAARWQEMADAANATPELVSAAAYAAGVSALSRALAGECDAALRLSQQAQALPAGAVATFSTGEAQALCGNGEGAARSLAALNGAYGRGSAAQAYLVPDLSATIAWKAGDDAGALSTLDAARQFDPLSLTAYLRGLVEISGRQPQLSIVQFQAMLSHRGPTTIFNPEVYPLAQLGLGRAYSVSGDAANSSAAYGRFLDLWNSADPGLAAAAEARSHAHQ